MEDKRKIPTLSTDNFVSESILKLDTAFAYFLTSEYSQSNMYQGTITSLKYILENNHGRESDITIAVNGALNDLLSNYFDKVDVFSQIKDNNLGISINVEDSEGRTHSLDRTLKLNDGKVNYYKELDYLLRK